MTEEVELKSVPKDVAKKMVQDYIQNNPGCKTSDIILNLELDPSLALEILKELEKEGLVQSKTIGHR